MATKNQNKSKHLRQHHMANPTNLLNTNDDFIEVKLLNSDRKDIQQGKNSKQRPPIDSAGHSKQNQNAQAKAVADKIEKSKKEMDISFDRRKNNESVIVHTDTESKGFNSQTNFHDGDVGLP